RAEPRAALAQQARFTVVGRQEAQQQAEQGGLAGAVAADDGVYAAARDAQAEVHQGLLAAEGLGQIPGFEYGVGHQSPPARGRRRRATSSPRNASTTSSSLNCRCTTS